MHGAAQPEAEEAGQEDGGGHRGDVAGDGSADPGRSGASVVGLAAVATSGAGAARGGSDGTCR